MSTTLEQAREYLECVKDLVGHEHREARKKLYDALPKVVQQEARRLSKAAYFVPENARNDERTEHNSPSGTYRLTITPFATGVGTWSYTQGLVYRGDQLIAEVQRNYSSFPFAWVEGHTQGDFFLCGEDYQGHTVIDLKTGGRRDSLEGGAEQGFGFCWAAIHPSPTGRLVAATGCFWGGPYEVRFYDFSSPLLLPWPEIDNSGELEEFFGWIDDDRAWVGGREEFYKPLDKSRDELRAARGRGEITEDDYGRYNNDYANWDERNVNEKVWQRPEEAA